jgi:hypothetical protein
MTFFTLFSAPLRYPTAKRNSLEILARKGRACISISVSASDFAQEKYQARAIRKLLRI